MNSSTSIPTSLGKRFTLKDMLETEDFILVDSSVRNLHLDKIYEGKTFFEIQASILKEQEQSLDLFLSLLEHPGVLITQGVSLELMAARNILGTKLSHLISNEKRNSNGHNGRRMHEHEKKKERLAEIQRISHRIYEVSRQSLFCPEQKGVYNLLEKIALTVANHTKAKIDYSEVYGDKFTQTQDYHTDEQLVAAAMYLSCVEEKKTGILTRDSDIKRIARNVVSYLDKSRQEGYKGILEMLRRNPIKVYYSHNLSEGKADLVVNSSWPTMRNEMNIFTPETIRKINSELFP